jgi:hypothetical protein
MIAWRDHLESDGFAMLPGVFSADEVRTALAEWESACARHAGDEGILAGDGPPYGARNLLELWPRVIELARFPTLRDPLVLVLGRAAGVVRVLFFDKPPGHSWALPWHKDYSIAVKEHRRVDGFTKPTIKAGVPHLSAPIELLCRMITVRVHFDDMNDVNGALRVIPGSHHSGHPEQDAPREPLAIHCRAGDVLLMRPLLTHASGHSQRNGMLHRRIVHLECAPDRLLPGALEWHDFRPLT